MSQPYVRPSRYALESLMDQTLNTIEQWYAAGLLSDSVVESWLALWNATPGRFSVASLSDGRIRTRLLP